MKTPTISRQQELLRTRFLTIKRFRTDFGDFKKDYDVVVFGPRAGLVVVKNEAILMTKQYRFLTRSYGWEIPGGTVDPGETAQAAAQRECLEETGIYCRELQPLLTYYPGLDNVDNKTWLFFTEDCEEQASFQPNEAEVLEIDWIPLDRILAKIAAGEILDAFTLIAILSYVHCRVLK